MGIDWEGLLGVEGDAMQDAYEDAIDTELEREYSRECWVAECSEEGKGFYEQRRLTPYYRKPEAREEQNAIQHWLNRRFQLELDWYAVGDEKPYGPAFLTTLKLDRIVTEEAGGRIVLLGRKASKAFDIIRAVLRDAGSLETDYDPYYQDITFQNPYGLGEEGAVEWQGTRPVLRSPYKYMDKYGKSLKSEYDFRGMPRKIVNTAKKDAVWWSWGKNYVWIQGEQYPNEEITWIFRRAEKFGRPVLEPEEAWSEKRLIWLPV